MILLSQSIAAWNTPAFRETFKREAEQINPDLLPLQQALALSSHVANRPFSIVPLHQEEDTERIRIKAGIFYYGIIAGCSCADDPTPIDEITEYCEVLFEISKLSAKTNITLLAE